jgi:AraC-like DNA-binding protein
MDSKPWHENFPLNFDFPFNYNSVQFSNFSFHWHEPVELVYVLSGSVIIFVDGKTFKAVQGDIIVINSQMVHGFYNAVSDTHLDIYQFSLGLFDSSLMDLRDQNSQIMVFDKIVRINITTDKAVYHYVLDLLLKIKNEYIEKKDGYHLVIKTLIYQMAIIFIRQIPSPEIPPYKLIARSYNRNILEKVLTYIHNNYSDQDVSLDRAAEVASLSKFYFTRFFRGQTGQTFHNYLNCIRINKAKEYLIETDKAIIDISFLCGFSSINTFNRLFKLYNGITPSDCRVKKFSTKQR